MAGDEWRDKRMGGGPEQWIAYARLLREAAEVSAGNWVFADAAGRRAIHALGRVALVKAADLSLVAYMALPEFSRERSDVLLKGAAVLGVATDWRGWT
jgi:hypothetical protein